MIISNQDSPRNPRQSSDTTFKRQMNGLTITVTKLQEKETAHGSGVVRQEVGPDLNFE